MNKVPKSIRVDYLIADDIDWRTKELGFNFTEWVEENYMKQFLPDKMLENEIKCLEKKLEKLKKRRTRLKSKTQNHGHLYKGSFIKELNNDQKQEIINSRNIIKNNPSLLKGRVKYWNNKFNDNLSIVKFKLLLENEK